ncbi:MAG: hypothetical protein RLZZ186_280 [Cyanobacteriota bacterium]|jgi:hypothetical protein
MTTESAADLPSTETQPGLLTIDGVSYSIDSIPAEIKVLVSDLIRVNQELAELQYRVRHSQAAQQTYVATIKKEIERLEIKPHQESDPSWSAKTA